MDVVVVSLIVQKLLGTLSNIPFTVSNGLRELEVMQQHGLRVMHQA